MLNYFEGTGAQNNYSDAINQNFFHIVAIDSLTSNIIISNKLNDEVIPKKFNNMNNF